MRSHDIPDMVATGPTGGGPIGGCHLSVLPLLAGSFIALLRAGPRTGLPDGAP